MKTDFMKRLLAAVPMLLTGVVIVILAMMMFVVLNIANGINDKEMWINAGFGLFLQIVMIIVWLPEGKKRGEDDTNYQDTKTTAEAKMRIAAQACNYDLLKKFCEEATAENIFAYISNKISRKFDVEYSRWTSSPTYVDQFSERTRKRVNRIERKAAKRAKPIKATEITSVSTIALVYDVENHTNAAETIRIVIKIFTILTTSVIGATIVFDGAVISWNSVLRFMYWMMIMGMTIFYSIRTGYRLITHEKKDYLQRMTDFLNRFESWKEKCEKSREM